MERRKYFIMMLTIMVVFCCVGFTHAEGEKGEEVKMINKVVTVKTYEGLVPATLRSEPGTTVIWVNHSPQPVEILFLDKKVVLACGAPVNFFVGKDGAYESGKIPFGGTASLCFTEKGKYEYVFKTSATFYPMKEKEHRGVVWIR